MIFFIITLINKHIHQFQTKKIPMKNFVIILFLLSALTFAQSPSFNNYGTIGFHGGLLNNQYGSGTAFGFQSNLIGSLASKSGFTYVFETSLAKIAFNYKDSPDNEGETMFIEAASFDIGFGYDFGPVYIAVIPYAWTWALNSSDGLAVLAKFGYANFVVEGKIVPVAYFTGYEYSMFDNNGLISVNYFFDEDFAIGVRHNRYGETSTTCLALNWNLF